MCACTHTCTHTHHTHSLQQIPGLSWNTRDGRAEGPSSRLATPPPITQHALLRGTARAARAALTTTGYGAGSFSTEMAKSPAWGMNAHTNHKAFPLQGQGRPLQGHQSSRSPRHLTAKAVSPRLTFQSKQGSYAPFSLQAARGGHATAICRRPSQRGSWMSTARYRDAEAPGRQGELRASEHRRSGEECASGRPGRPSPRSRLRGDAERRGGGPQRCNYTRRKHTAEHALTRPATRASGRPPHRERDTQNAEPGPEEELSCPETRRIVGAPPFRDLGITRFYLGSEWFRDSA